MKREMNRDKVSLADIHFVGRRHIIIRAMRLPKTQRSHSSIGISSLAELTQEFGKRIVDKFQILWSALNKAVERDDFISEMVIRAEPPSEALQDVHSMIV